MKYAFIRAHSKQYKVNRMCRALDVSESGYYGWRERPESARSRQNRTVIAQIKQHHKKSRYTYGSPRIHRDLLDSGVDIGVNKVARLMKDNGIQSKMARKFVITTDSKNTKVAAQNLLNQRFHVKDRNQAWVSDTTFIPSRKGWMYLAVVLDLYSRRVIGWAMSDRNDSKLVCDALVMALWRRGKATSVIVHSDQGSTYASGSYQQLLRDNKLVCSMSRKGQCLDNAVAESFFSTLKTELVVHEDFRTHEQARQSIFEYIEVFYNRQRRHSYIGFSNPVAYEMTGVSAST